MDKDLKEIEKRPTWDEWFADIVAITATRSPCARLHVGCLIVKDNRIIAQGYNGYLAGCAHEQIIKDGHEIATIHAEQNAIADCAKRGVSCDGATIYITHFPCFICMKMICAVGIKEIKYIDDYRNDELVYKFAKMATVEIHRLVLR